MDQETLPFTPPEESVSLIFTFKSVKDVILNFYAKRFRSYIEADASEVKPSPTMTPPKSDAPLPTFLNDDDQDGGDDPNPDGEDHSTPSPLSSVLPGKNETTTVTPAERDLKNARVAADLVGASAVLALIVVGIIAIVFSHPIIFAVVVGGLFLMELAYAFQQYFEYKAWVESLDDDSDEIWH